MADSFFPDDDAGILTVAQAFASGLAREPAKYALSESDVRTISATVDAYARAKAIADEESTRTKKTINEKDTARNSMVRLLRTYINIIRANQGITDADKMNLGIKPWKTDMTPRMCPQTSPCLGFKAATPGQHTITVTDAVSREKKKPFGATRLELFMTLIGPNDEIPTSPVLPGQGEHDGTFDGSVNWAWYVGSFTKSKFDINHPQPTKPRRAVYWGRWANNKGQVGPWSLALVTQFVGKGRVNSENPNSKNETDQPHAAADANLKLAA